jgi:hypothetical protein
MHLEEDSAIFLKMLREIVASMEITWKAYRNFDPEIRQREFEQYCSRIFMGSWLAIRNLPKTQFAATPQAPHNAA